MSGFDVDVETVLRAKTGEEEALLQILTRFMPLIRSAAGRFSVQTHMFSRKELIQAGCIGLLCAIRRFHSSSECALGTYALPWILGEMRRTIRHAVDSTGAYEARSKIAKESLRLTEELHRSPTVGEIAQACAMNAFEVVSACQVPEVSDEECGSYADREEVFLLRFALEELKEEERKIILLRYFRDRTQGETARIMGKSQAQISRIERRALDRLRVLMA